MANKEPKPDKDKKPSKTDAEAAWEAAKKDIPRHDAEFDAKHGKGRDE